MGAKGDAFRKPVAVAAIAVFAMFLNMQRARKLIRVVVAAWVPFLKLVAYSAQLTDRMRLETDTWDNNFRSREFERRMMEERLKQFPWTDRSTHERFKEMHVRPFVCGR